MPVFGSIKDYHYGTKNNWRRTVWNELLRRANGREKTDPIVYLSGPQDYDRQIATQKGVPDLNLIGIDKSSANVRRLKSQAKLAIDADVVDVIRAWPVHRRVAGVLLDFCSGLEDRLWMPLMNCISREPFHESVVALNFMRGRDPSSNLMRSTLDRCVIDHRTHSMIDISVFLGFPHVKCMTDLSRSPKNRALMWFFGCFALSTHDDNDERFSEASGLAFLELTKPMFLSYKSGMLTFDTVIFRPFTTVDFPVVGWTNLPNRKGMENILSAMHPRNDEIARRIIATLAVRTRRESELVCR